MPPVVAAGAETASRVALPFVDRISLPRRHRNRERERAAGARRALHLDAAAVRLDCQLAEGEAETGAGPSGVELTEFFEDSLERCVRNPNPGIADCEPDVLCTVRRRGDRHGAAACELDCIRHEVDERARQLFFITGKVR